MLIVHVIGGFGFGGTEKLCLNLVASMPCETRHLVIGLDPSRTGIESQLSAHENVQLQPGRSPLAGRVSFLFWMLQTFRRERPDGVVLHIFGVAHVLTAIAWRLFGGRANAIAVAAGNPAPEIHGRLKWRTLVIISRLLRVPIMSYSRWVHTTLLELGSRLPARSSVIYNGIDVLQVSEQAKAAGISRESPTPWVIGMVSRLDAIKDQATLIRAFALLPKNIQNRPILLRLVGDGGLRGELENLTRELGVASRVEFTGSRDDVPQQLGLMDIYAFSTTRDEGFGIALIEAMAAGLPIVATDVPPCREITGEGIASLLVPPCDATAFADALLLLLENSDRRRQLAIKAHTRAMQLFDIQLTVECWMDVLNLPQLEAA